MQPSSNVHPRPRRSSTKAPCREDRGERAVRSDRSRYTCAPASRTRRPIASVTSLRSVAARWRSRVFGSKGRHPPELARLARHERKPERSLRDRAPGDHGVVPRIDADGLTLLVVERVRDRPRLSLRPRFRLQRERPVPRALQRLQRSERRPLLVRLRRRTARSQLHPEHRRSSAAHGDGSRLPRRRRRGRGGRRAVESAGCFPEATAAARLGERPP
jgi:hypothetical protein